ncbi:hypothetical protein KCP73_25505 [Salmonella enterica subsp. enterica]|nr:hypothetical protein KCP73_25505 [Salmonella enterica subsp. enterica]
MAAGIVCQSRRIISQTIDTPNCLFQALLARAQSRYAISTDIRSRERTASPATGLCPPVTMGLFLRKKYQPDFLLITPLLCPGARQSGTKLLRRTHCRHMPVMQNNDATVKYKYTPW